MPPAKEEEEDYMSMIIEEPQQKETLTQKKLRKQREAESRAKIPSKAERAAQEAARRDEALSTSTLNPANKGYQMMAKLGYKPGEALGKRDPSPSSNNRNNDNDGGGDTTATTATAATAAAGDDSTYTANMNKLRTEPLNLIFKEDRGGIGLDSEKKRKIREEADDAVKKIKREEGDYRDRVRIERETRRTEAQVRAAQSVAERLDAEAEAEAEAEADTNEYNNNNQGEEEEETVAKSDQPDSKEPSRSPTSTPTPTQHQRKPKPAVKPTSQINILYRSLVRERQEKERSLHTRHALESSLPSSFLPNPRLPGYDDPTLEREDKQALLGLHGGSSGPDLSGILEEEVEEEDPELEEFNALEPGERLMRLVVYLRERHRYCFWCKCRYESGEFEGCPGVTEEDHD